MGSQTTLFFVFFVVWLRAETVRLLIGRVVQRVDRVGVLAFVLLVNMMADDYTGIW